MKPRPRDRTVVSSIGIIVFASVLACLVLRLLLGMIDQAHAIYPFSLMMFYHPIYLLRHIDTVVIFIMVYAVLWLYVVLRKVLVLRQPPFTTVLWSSVWMAIGTIPFVPFGIHYFSLLRYNSTITSYAVRSAPFAGMFVVFLATNLAYFRQRVSSGLIWAINGELVVVLLITFSDLLPVLKTVPFFNVLNYDASRLYYFIAIEPVMAQGLVTVLICICLVLLNRHFMLRHAPTTIASRLLIPLLITIVVIAVLTVLQNDFQRYRRFRYRSETGTTYATNYDDRELIRVHREKIRVSHGSFRMPYPLGDFGIRDTLWHHARQLNGMAIIEGLDFYRFNRILEILTHGPRDTAAYESMKDIVDVQRCRFPEHIYPLLSELRERYEEGAGDIVCRGWITLNGMPLAHCDFFLEQWVSGGTEYPEWIWKDRTDAEGRFDITCFRGQGSPVRYFQISFLLSDLHGEAIDYVRVRNLPSIISQTGTHILDTINVEVSSSPHTRRYTINVYPDAPVDSFQLSIPKGDEPFRVELKATVLHSGTITIDSITTTHTLEAQRVQETMIEHVKIWRFFSAGDDRDLRMYMQVQ